MKAYNELANSKKFIGNQPVTFTKWTYDPKLNYFITHKLDGKRHLYFISNFKHYLVNSLSKFEPIVETPVNHVNKNTILDGELYKGVYYAFDILFYRGVDLRNINLAERLSYLYLTVYTENNPKLQVKDHIGPFNRNQLCEEFYKYKSKYSTDLKNGVVDGIILSPNSDYYKKVLKWKPGYLLTIDFKIKKELPDKIILLSSDSTQYIPNPRFKEYQNVGIITVNKRIYNKYPDNSVVEFYFDKKSKTFKPLKERPDKINSNYIRVINDNFNQIIYPDSPKKIFCTKSKSK